jgi:hypothetical protein
MKPKDIQLGTIYRNRGLPEYRWIGAGSNMNPEIPRQLVCISEESRGAMSCQDESKCSPEYWNDFYPDENQKLFDC